MDSFIDALAKVLANFTLFAAVSGAGAASHNGAYQPETPKSLLK